MRKLSIYLAVIMLALVFAGCKDSAQAPTDGTGKAEDTGTAAKEPEVPDVVYKDQKVGKFNVSVEQFGKLVVGKETCFIISVKGGDSVALRAWVGDESAKGSVKTTAKRLGPGKYDADVEIPTGAGKLWLEVRDKDGKTTGSIEVK